MTVIHTMGRFLFAAFFGGIALFPVISRAAEVNCEAIGGSCSTSVYCTDTARYEPQSKSGTSCESNTLAKQCCIPKATAGSCDPSKCLASANCSGTLDFNKHCSGASFCCGAPSAAQACTGKDASGNSRTGQCSTSATCASGNPLSGASGCSAGIACCGSLSPSPSGSCESTAGQKCSSDCTKESGFTAGGTGSCFDAAKNQCCKPTQPTAGNSTTMCSGSQNSGIVPCGRSCDNPATPNDESKICTLCHLLLLVQNITTWIFTVMTYIAIAVIVAMGILYIVSAGKPGLINIAKGGLWSTLVGFAVVLLGWVTINVILFVLANGTLGQDTATFSIKQNGAWFEYRCDAESKYKRTGLTTGAPGSAQNSGGVNIGGSSGGGGNCSVVNNASSACAVQNMTCFGSRAQEASKICNFESGGKVDAVSGTDKCKDGASFSHGIWQINLVTTKASNGLPSACEGVFVGSMECVPGGYVTNSQGVRYCGKRDCSVAKKDQLDACLKAIRTPAINTAAACRLYKVQGFDAWPHTRSTCGVSK